MAFSKWQPFSRRVRLIAPSLGLLGVKPSTPVHFSKVDWSDGCDGFEVGLLFEEHEERNIVIVVRHVGSARLAFRRGHGIHGSLSAVECAGPVPEEFAGAAVHRTDRPIAVAFNSGQFGGHRPVDFAVVLLEMLGIVGCLVENDELDHWYLLFWFGVQIS